MHSLPVIARAAVLTGGFLLVELQWPVGASAEVVSVAANGSHETHFSRPGA